MEIILIFGGFICFWLLVTYAVSRFSGWYAAAKVYANSEKEKADKMFRFRSGKIRKTMRYDNVLHLGVKSEGLILKVALPFKLGSPDLFIPWKEVERTESQILFFKRTTLCFSKAEKLTVTISRSLADRLYTAAGKEI